MSYIYKTKVCMGATDATGALYFTEMMRFGLEAFEHFLSEKGFELSGNRLPIVHAEADYRRPFQLWDEVVINLTCSRIGTTSFTIESDMGVYGRSQIVHVVVDVMGNKQPINDGLRHLLLQLAPLSQACPSV